MPANHVFAIVLAAGKSSRFRAVKQLENYQGMTLVARAARLAEQSCGSRSVMVLGNDWRPIAASCAPLRGFFVVNSEFADGIATSIAAGIRSVRHAADAVLVVLADQPLVSAGHLQALIAEWKKHPDTIVASRYSDTLGPPAVFPQKYFAALTQLEGDTGARHLLRTMAGEIRQIDFADGAVDIDTPEDLRKLY